MAVIASFAFLNLSVERTADVWLNIKGAVMRQMIGPILVLMLVVTGCAATQEAKSVEKSGFLGDYSLLKEGERSTFQQGAENQALLVYKNPAADWRKYIKGTALRVGMVGKEGLEPRYRGGTGYALDAAMHGSGNQVG
jgi:hypothetical protein